ncbi:RTA1 like protein-domain-containing protein [Lipomyces oligophaga]|uniref:RTA1 like protein-domain-containing protein n=1 Tax=Lipomyces oligophaga TaxID=45792 RepID=UPI0034CD2F9F
MHTTTYQIYGYTPSFSPNLAALVIFAVFWVAHMTLSVVYRQAWIGTTFSIACGLETAGYIGRVLSSKADPMADAFNDYLVQIICLTIAPVFFMAGIYFMFAQVTLIYGPAFSRVRPWTYSRVFIVLDVVCLVLQAAGGGIAASADGEKEAQHGTNIMVGGLALQVAVTTIFFILCADFAILARKATKAHSASGTPFPPDMFPEKFAYIRDHKFVWYIIYGNLLAVIFVYTRSIYRVAELSEGWSGFLMNHENYFLVLDALMVGLGVFCTLVFYSSIIVGRIPITREFKIIQEQCLEVKAKGDDLDMSSEQPYAYKDDQKISSADINA